MVISLDQTVHVGEGDVLGEHERGTAGQRGSVQRAEGKVRLH